MSKPDLTNNKNSNGSHSLAKGILGFLFSPLVAAIAIIGCAVVNSVAAGAKMAGLKRMGKKIDNFFKHGPLALFFDYMHYSLNNLNNPKSDGSAPPRHFITQAPQEDQGADVTANSLKNPLKDKSLGDETASPSTTVDAPYVTGIGDRPGCENLRLSRS